ncbi:DUF1697 domain-containing protein [Lacinutrix salivirga]
MNTTYVLFLRGINVGAHHKVPMAILKKELESLELKDVITILNSGNVIFKTSETNTTELESLIANHLETVFGFAIPVLVRTAKAIVNLLQNSPFKDYEITKDTRFYVSFLAGPTNTQVKTTLQLPWKSKDSSFKLVENRINTIAWILDVSKYKTPKAMQFLEQHFGKNITTRNWNTLLKIEKKL